MKFDSDIQADLFASRMDQTLLSSQLLNLISTAFFRNFHAVCVLIATY